MRSTTFASKSTPGVTYTTTVGDDGQMKCDCRGWTVKKGNRPRECTHTKQVAAGQETRVVGDYVYLTAGFLTGAGSPPVAPPIEAPAPSPGGRIAPPMPMLASAMIDAVSGAAFDRCYGKGGEWVMEEKIDGHRLTVMVDAGTVRGYARPRAGASMGKPRPLPENIQSVLARFPDGIYDGELATAEPGKSWGVTVTGAPLLFVIFDLLEIQGEDTIRLPFSDRRQLLDYIWSTVEDIRGGVLVLPLAVPSWAGVEAIWARGGEGVIVKRSRSTYLPGARSLEWIKVKAKAAAVLTLTGYEAGKCGPFSKLCLRDDAGIETTVKTLGNAMLRQIEAAPDSFVGRRVVISYQERTPDGSYRHGQFDHFEAA